MPERDYITINHGRPAHGYRDAYGHNLKVSVAWTRPQFEAINRRVVKNKSTFAKEARRLVAIGLRMDHINDPS